MVETNITFVIHTFNEERRIKYLLRCFKDYGKILLADDGSTDKTIEIAESYGAEYFIRDKNWEWGEEERAMEYIQNKVDTDWIYLGSVDELCPRKLLEKFVEVAGQNKYKIIYARRINMHYGIENLGLEHTYQIRLFKKSSIDFENNCIHYFGKIVCRPEEILYLPRTDEYSIYHFSTYNLSKFEINTNKYGDIEAQQNVKNGKKFSFIKMLLKPLKIFLKCYLFNGSWKYGMPGFVMTMQFVFFCFNVAAKTWELESNLTLENIEKRYDKLKEKLLADNERERYG